MHVHGSPSSGPQDVSGYWTLVLKALACWCGHTCSKAPPRVPVGHLLVSFPDRTCLCPALPMMT